MKLSPAEIFKVFGLQRRVKIIELLKSKGTMGAKDIARILGVTVSAVSQHLRVLRQVGLVRSERKGYYIPYSINEEELESCRCLLNEVCSCKCKTISRFKVKKLNNMRLASLIKYEKELRKETQNVQKRILEIQNKRR